MSWPLNHGCAYMVPIHHAWLWFPESTGLASGIVIAGFALGALVFDNVSTYLINPKNVSSDDPLYSTVIDDRFV